MCRGKAHIFLEEALPRANTPQFTRKENGMITVLKRVQKHWIVEAILGSLLAYTCLIMYIMMHVLDAYDPYVCGGLALMAMVLGMNSLAKTELLLTSKGPEWFRKHPVMKWIHHHSEEGEIAGIVIGGIILFFQFQRHVHVHFAFKEAFTLLGIMSAAVIATRNMMPVMQFIERHLGTWAALVIGACLSALTGEPSAAVFISEHFKRRVPDEHKGRVATGLGAIIGSGGGLCYFSAPPILIIWFLVKDAFGWDAMDLLMYVGGACVLHVAVISWRLRELIYVLPDVQQRKEEPTPSLFSQWPLLLLVVVVVANVTQSFHGFYYLVWGMDCIVGIAGVIAAYKGMGESEGEEQSGHPWQPWILAILLIAIEVAGVDAEELLLYIAGLIPQTWPVLIVAFMLFFLTAWMSHIADNALASRIMILVAIALQETVGHGDLFALSVIVGALFGGFVLVPANLPNFAIVKEFAINAIIWARYGWRWYWSVFVPIAWITFWYYLGA